MNKYLLLLLPLTVFASGEKLTTQEHNSIHGYNQRAVVKMNEKQNMHKLHKIDEKELALLVKKETGEEALSIKLSHSGKYLLYRVKTKSYFLEVNALDKTVMKKEKR